MSRARLIQLAIPHVAEPMGTAGVLTRRLYLRTDVLWRAAARARLAAARYNAVCDAITDYSDPAEAARDLYNWDRAGRETERAEAAEAELAAFLAAHPEGKAG